METIKSLDKTSFNNLFLAFSEAFKDYDIQISKPELEVMLSRRGFIPKLSFGAFDNDQLVSFTLNGIGTFNELQTAYDTGTGTIEAYRGRGLASRIFMHSIPELKDAGVQQYLLEVLQHNKKAISVYQKLGFQVSREFNYFREKVENVRPVSGELPAKYQIQPIDLKLIKQMNSFLDFVPSWQNSFEAIARCLTDFLMWGVFTGEELAGYCIFESKSGDITQIAVAQEHRKRGLATCLMQEAIKNNRHRNLKLINSDIRCEAMTRCCASIGLTLQGQQFEMIRKI
jgi:ribosomal protein S18 acetylase RimI-like enzyme